MRTAGYRQQTLTRRGKGPSSSIRLSQACAVNYSTYRVPLGPCVDSIIASIFQLAILLPRSCSAGTKEWSQCLNGPLSNYGKVECKGIGRRVSHVDVSGHHMKTVLARTAVEIVHVGQKCGPVSFTNRLKRNCYLWPTWQRMWVFNPGCATSTAVPAVVTSIYVCSVTPKAMPIIVAHCLDFTVSLT